MLQEALALVRELTEQNKNLWAQLEETQKSRDEWKALAEKIHGSLVESVKRQHQMIGANK